MCYFLKMDLATFRLEFTEFKTIPDGQIQAALDRAEEAVDPVTFGASYDLAHGLRAAHLLAVAPMGQNARLQSDKADTTYNRTFREIQIRKANAQPFP